MAVLPFAPGGRCGCDDQCCFDAKGRARFASAANLGAGFDEARRFFEASGTHGISAKTESSMWPSTSHSEKIVVSVPA